MSAQKPEDYVPKIARNELFYFVARASTLIASGIGLPIAGWMLTRVITQADALNASQIQQNIELKVLSSRIEDRLSSDLRQLSDHELRLRAVERVK